MYTIVYNSFYLPLKKFSNQNMTWKHPKFYMGNFFFTQARYIYFFSPSHPPQIQNSKCSDLVMDHVIIHGRRRSRAAKSLRFSRMALTLIRVLSWWWLYCHFCCSVCCAVGRYINSFGEDDLSLLSLCWSSCLVFLADADSWEYSSLLPSN